MPKFPFIGSRVEVISYDGVRYTGQLQFVNSAVKSITVVKVHHHGTENRHFDGHLPKGAKGPLPEKEHRVIYAEYIRGLRVAIDEGSCQPTVPAHDTRAEIIPSQSEPSQEEAEVGAKQQPPEDNMQPSTSNSAFFHDAHTPCSSRTPETMDLDLELKDEINVDDRASPDVDESTQPTFSLYFIAQLQLYRAVCVLINSSDRPSAPAYVAIDYDHFPISPVPGQVWAVRRYRWLGNRRHMVCHQFVKSEHPEGLNAFVRVAGGMPWMYDYMINPQAYALGRVELVHDVETVNRRGQIVAILDRSEGWRFVEIEAPGLTEGVRLLEMQYDLRDGGVPYSRLKCGDAVSVEMVKLEAGCWVGPKYVLPNIDYRRDRPPFMPCLMKRYRTVRAENALFFPFRFST